MIWIVLPFQHNDERPDRVSVACSACSLYLYISCMAESWQLQVRITDAASQLQGRRVLTAEA